MNFETTVVRCLNYWKKQYLPTYLGVRTLLEKNNNLGLLEKTVLRKLEIGYKPVHYSYKMYKKTNDKGIHEYRTFHALSPFSALCEAVVVEKLQNALPTFSDRVFSYLKPNEFEGNFFKYYFNGYNKRNRLLTEHFLSNKELIANIFDITDYYPSINTELCITKIEKLTSETKGLNDCFHFLRSLYSENDGVLVGPAISSILGTVALLDFDKRLEEKYGNYYFRYVDDIIVLSNQNDIEEVKGTVKKELEYFGFQTNVDKYCFGGAEDWLRYNSLSSNNNILEIFFNRIRLFLYRNKGKENTLKENLHSSGITVPLYKYKSDIAYTRFLKYFFSFIPRNPYLLKYIIKDTIPEIVQEGKNVREAIRNGLLNLLTYKQPLNKFQEKLFKIKFTFFLNRLLTFSRIEKFPEILSIFNNYVTEDRSKLVSIFDNAELTDIYPYANSSVNWAAMIMKDTGLYKEITTSNVPNGSDYLLETLACYGVIKLKNREMEMTKTLWKKIVNPTGKRVHNDLSYEDEIDVLLSPFSYEEITSFMENRYNEHEEFFETFSSDDYYSS